MDEPLHLGKASQQAKYVVCFDPVDGSSNIDMIPEIPVLG